MSLNACPNLSCPWYEGIFPMRCVCCFGVFFNESIANFVRPLVIVVGIVLSILSYRALSSLTESSDHTSITRKFQLPAHYFLTAISFSSGVYFLSTLPWVVYRCTTLPIICTELTGAFGYSVTISVWIFAYFGNDCAHWVSFFLIACYGIERCLMLKYSRSLSESAPRYCHFLAIQLAAIQSYVKATRYVPVKGPSGRWENEQKSENAGGGFLTNMAQIRYLITLSTMAVAFSSYVYILKSIGDFWLKHRNSVNKQPLERCGRNSLVSTKDEWNLTKIYVVISSLYMASIISASIHVAIKVYFDNNIDITDPYVQCNGVHIIQELTNILWDVSELMAASMGLVVSKIVALR